MRPALTHCPGSSFVFDAIRTPRAKAKDGSLRVKPVNLLAGLLTDLQQRNRFDTARVDDVVMGIVSPVGDQGAVLPKVAALKANWDFQCAGVPDQPLLCLRPGSREHGRPKVRSGWEDLVVAGGVESMSRVPIGSDGGAWAMDPETNSATAFVPQGIGADLIRHAGRLQPPKDVDAFALESQSAPPPPQAAGADRSVVPSGDSLGQIISGQGRVHQTQHHAGRPGGLEGVV